MPRLLLIGLCCVLGGCPGESPDPIGPASGGWIEPGLLGSWQCRDEENEATDAPDLLTFRRFDETQYFVSAEGDGYRAFASSVGEHSFLNVQKLASGADAADNGYTFLRYSFLDDGSLRLEGVAESVLEAIESGWTSRDAVAAALENPAGFSDPLVCLRPAAPEA